MSIHDRFESLADLYAAGGLSDDERREVAEHAAGCAPCGAALRDVEAFTKWAAGAIAPDAPPAALEDRVIGRLWPHSPTRRPKPSGEGFPREAKILAGLAAAALLVLIGWIFEQRHTTILEGIAIQDARMTLHTSVESLDASGASTGGAYMTAPLAGHEGPGTTDLSGALSGKLAYAPSDLRIDGAYRLWDENGYSRTLSPPPDIQTRRKSGRSFRRNNARQSPAGSRQGSSASCCGAETGSPRSSPGIRQVLRTPGLHARDDG